MEGKEWEMEEVGEGLRKQGRTGGIHTNKRKRALMGRKGGTMEEMYGEGRDRREY